MSGRRYHVCCQVSHLSLSIYSRDTRVGQDEQGKKAPKTKPQLIMVLVKRMNHLCLVPFFRSPVDSAHPTLPAGYSPEIVVSSVLLSEALFYFLLHTSDTDAYKETPGGQYIKHANRVAAVVGRRGEGCKDDENNSRYDERVGSRPAVGKEAKQQLANDGTSKRNVSNILGGL